MNDSISYKEELSELDLSASKLPYIRRKILILGGQGVGKTSIIKRYKSNIYIDEYEPTIQITSKKVINFNNDYISLEIVDLEGQTENTIYTPNKFSFGYNGYVLVYDVRDIKSFDLIKKIYEQIAELSGNISKILVGTKSDKSLENNNNFGAREVSFDEGKKLAEKIHCPFIEVSSQDNKNIEEIFRLLLIEINKTESGVNLKHMKFLKIFQFFLHHQKLMINCYYINLIILIVISLILFYFGIYLDFSILHEKIIEQDNYYYFGIGFPFIVLGLWGIIINVSGIVGMKNQNVFLLRLNYMGLIFGIIFSLISICQYITINIFQDLESSNIMINIQFFIIIIIPMIIGIILCLIHKEIFLKDLKSYMA